jgi:signal peptidase I
MKSKLQKEFSRLNKSYTHLKNGRLNRSFGIWEKASEEKYTYAQSLVKSLEQKLSTISQELSKDEGSIDPLYLKNILTDGEELYAQLDEYSKPWWMKITDSFTFLLIVVLFVRTFVFGIYQVPTGSAEPNLLVGDRLWGNKTAYYFSPVRRGDLVMFDNPEFNYAPEGTIANFWQRNAGIAIPLLGLPEGPSNPANVVKRVIGIPGDTIEIKVEEGRTAVYRNDQKLEEPYVNPLPLIAVHKQVGLISSKSFLAPLLPRMFVKRKKDHVVWYVYDPNKALNEQPYYNIQPEEIKRSIITGEPLLKLAEEPDYQDRAMKITVPDGHYWCMGDSRRNSHDSRSWGLVAHKHVYGRASCILYSIDTEEPWGILELLKHPIDFWRKKLRMNRFFKFLKNPIPEDQQL